MVFCHRMRILALSNFFPPLVKGGLEISAGIICSSLAKSGHLVDVVTRSHEPMPEDRSDRLTVHRIFEHRYRYEDIPGHPARLHGWLSVDAAFRNGAVNKPILRSFLRGRTFDVAICFSLQDVGMSLASEIHRHGIPIAWSIADYWHIEHRNVGTVGLLAKVRRNYLLRSQVRDELSYPLQNAVFISHYMLDAYAEAGIRPQNSHVVHRSYPCPESVEPYESPNRKRTFMVACQLAEHKGIHIVVQAAAELAKTHGTKEWTIEIFGDGDPSYVGRLRKAIEIDGLNDRVLLKGKIGHREVGDRMQRSMAFIHAAIWEEPFGRVAIESMANGVPLIAGEAHAIHEIVDDGEALIYPRTDPSGLAGAMRFVLDNPDSCAEMARAGIEKHRRLFVPEVEQTRMLSILTDVASVRSADLPPSKIT